MKLSSTKQQASRVKTQKISIVGSTASSIGNLIIKLLTPTDDPAETRRKFISLGGGLLLVALVFFEQAHAIFLSLTRDHHSSLPTYFSGQSRTSHGAYIQRSGLTNPKLSLFQRYFCRGAETSPDCGYAALSPLVEYYKKQGNLDSDEIGRALQVPTRKPQASRTFTCTRSWFRSDCKF